MFQNIRTEEKIWRWRWPIIVVAVIGALLALQIFRVNKRPPPTASEVRVYTSPGTLISGELIVPAADHYLTRIDLNRRARIAGEFRTAGIKLVVSVLVIKESDFASWNSDLDFTPIVQTGFVPGGKINPVLEPGAYFLIVDNRRSSSPQVVHSEFILE